MSDKIGPTGKYTDGKAGSRDRGGLNVGFFISKERRLVVLNFGTQLSWLSSTPEEALSQASTIRTKILAAFGELAYEVSELPLKVVADSRRVSTTLPQSVSTLAANPEMFLAWAERIEAVAHEILLEAVDKSRPPS